MPDMIEYREDTFTWPKGATYWGEPLPFKQAVDGKEYVVYDGWWTEARLKKLAAWAADSTRYVRNVVGSDRNQTIRARARVFMDQADRWKEEGKLNLTGLFNNWQPTEEQQERVDQLVRSYQKVREEVRAALAAAVAMGGDLADDLGDDPAAWNEVNMTGAVFRLPKVIMWLVRLNEVPDPGTVVPEKALV